MTNDLMMDLTEDEMLELWKSRFRLLPARRDCTIEREDGIDIDAVLLTDIREWYAGLLLKGDVEMLPVEDLSKELFADVSTDGVVTVPLPACCVRPVEWHVEGWERSVTRFYHPSTVEARCQNNFYLRGDTYNPAAVIFEDRLVLYSVKPGVDALVDKALCVVRPAGGHYKFNEAALATIWDYAKRYGFAD